MRLHFSLPISFSFSFFLSAPLRLDILLQDEKIARLSQQIHELTELNRKCDKHKKRQQRFLQTIINSSKGDNVPLSESACAQQCKKHRVKGKLCKSLCKSTNDYSPPCNQNWRRKFNRNMKFHDSQDNVRHTSSFKASDLESLWQSDSLKADQPFTQVKLLDDMRSSLGERSKSRYVSKRGISLAHYNTRNGYSHHLDYHKRQHDYKKPLQYGYDYKYSDYVDSPMNVILSSREETDLDYYNGRDVYAEKIAWESPPSSDPVYVIPDPLSPKEQTLPTNGLNVTVPILGELRLRDEELLRKKPIGQILCRQLTCVTNSGFTATVCFLAYDPDIYMAENVVSNTTFGKPKCLLIPDHSNFA